MGHVSPSPTKIGQTNQVPPCVVETPSKGRCWSPHRVFNPDAAEADHIDVSSAKKRFVASNTAIRFRTRTSKKGGSYIHSNFKMN
jgi:hypothetical protein